MKVSICCDNSKNWANVPVNSSSSSSCSVILWRWSPSLADLEVVAGPLAFFILRGDLALLVAPMKWAKSSVCWSKNSNRFPRPPSDVFGVGASAGVAADDDDDEPLELEGGLAILWQLNGHKQSKSCQRLAKNLKGSLDSNICLVANPANRVRTEFAANRLPEAKRERRGGLGGTRLWFNNKDLPTFKLNFTLNKLVYLWTIKVISF